MGEGGEKGGREVVIKWQRGWVWLGEGDTTLMMMKKGHVGGCGGGDLLVGAVALLVVVVVMNVTLLLVVVVDDALLEVAVVEAPHFTFNPLPQPPTTCQEFTT